MSYVPSLSALREMRTLRGRRLRGGALLAMGNPGVAGTHPASARGDAAGPAMPETEAELRAIQKLYPDRARVYVGPQATERRFKNEAGQYAIVHLASHGILDNANPMYSHVILARSGDSSEDGQLEAWEIARMNLHADLVVLSACETARGRAAAGEGMIGLSWALFLAGARSSVVSMWKVDASSTSDLMVAFYRRLAAPNASKAKALRDAALELVHGGRYSHPFYWAPFVVVGDAY